MQYCKQCEARLRRGLRPDPACLECRGGETHTYRQIPFDVGTSATSRGENEPIRRETPPTMRFFDRPAPSAPVPPRPASPSDRLRGHLVCTSCRRLVLPSAARAAEDRVFCESCYLALPICRACGERVLSPSDGGTLCSLCLSRAVRCEQCDGIILPSELYVCDGHSFCEGCYDGLEECDQCGSKMYLYDENALTLLCAECKTSHTVCELCGAIVANSAVFMAEEHPVCPSCFDRLDECEDCGCAVFAHPDDLSHPRLCAQCLDRYVLCEVCREPIPLEESDRYIVDERVLCENCYDDLPECEECYQHFFPDPSAERGTVACPACRDDFTTCDACGRRIRFTDAYEREGKLLCTDCNRRFSL